MKNVRGHNVGVQAPADAGQPGPGDFLDDHRAVPEVGTGTAIGLGYGGTQKAQLSGLAPKLPADLTVFFPLIMVRRGFLLQELAHGVAEAFQVGIEQGTWNHGEPR